MTAPFNPNANYGTPTSTTFPGTGAAASPTPTTTPATPTQPALPALSAEQVAALGLTSGTQAASVKLTSDPNALAGVPQVATVPDALALWFSINSDQREHLEQLMADGGLITQSEVTGSATGPSDKAYLAWKKVIDNVVGAAAVAPNTSVLTMLQAGANTQDYAQVATEIQKQISNATAISASETPTIASLTDTAAADQTLSKAFMDALGYTPSAQQMQTFVSTLHAAQIGEAGAQNAAKHQAAQQDLAQAKAANTALQKLGPDGLDAFLSAYRTAVSGTGVSGVGTTQGPVTGQVAKPHTNMIPPGSTMAPGTEAGFNPSGTEMVGNVPPTQKVVPAGTKQEPVEKVTGVNFNLQGMSPSDMVSTSRVGSQTVRVPAHTVGVPSTVQDIAPTPPAGNPAAQETTPQFGGLYALSPKAWNEAKTALANTYPNITKYATAGQAPQVLQQNAASYLAEQMYSQYGNWNDVAVAMAGGTPGKAGTVLGKPGSHIDNFGQTVANQVNNELHAVLNQVNSPAVPVIARQSPNPAADALAAAEAADPASYAAHNMSLAEGELSNMLYGTPQLESMSTSNVQGDIAQVSGTVSTGGT